MGFWSKLGKIGLQAAPYVAAPFTGGASLLAVPATQKIGQKLAESSARKREAKGLAPSSFNDNLNMASGLFGGAYGMSGGFGGKLGGVGSGKYAPQGMGGQSGKGGTDWGGIVNQGMNAAGSIFGNMGGGGTKPYIDESGAMGRPSSGNIMKGVGPRNAPMSQVDQSNPNLAEFIGQGRREAIQNQPFRRGYDVTIPGPEPADDAAGNVGTPTTVRMPRITPTGGRNRRQNRQGY